MAGELHQIDVHGGSPDGPWRVPDVFVRKV
jgi:hypothetical protein